MKEDELYQLRLGNLLKTEDGEVINVWHIQKNFYSVSINGKYPGLYHSIPLTEEWLQRLGFEKNPATGA